MRGRLQVSYMWYLTASVWRKSCKHFQVYCYWQMARKGKDLNVQDRTQKENKMQNDNERERERKENLKTQLTSLFLH